MFTRELTYGEALRLQVDRCPADFVEIADACDAFEEAARATYAELLSLEEAPTSASRPGRKRRRRLYVLALALALDPAEFGLTSDDRSDTWPGDEMLARSLHKALWAGRDSKNPEPAGSMLYKAAA